MPKPRILITEDEVILVKQLKLSTSKLGYEVAGTASTGEEAIRLAGESRPDLVLMDIVLQGEMDGIDAAARIRDEFDIPVVYITGYPDGESMERVKASEPYGYLTKPVVLFELKGTIETALYRHGLAKKLKESEELHRITLSMISDAVFITDDDNRFTYICPNVSTIFGYSYAEVQELRHISELLGEGLFDPDHLERQGEIVNIERTIVDKSGREHVLLVNVKRVSIKDGTVLHTCHDVTEVRRAEEALKESQEWLQVAVEGADVGIWGKDLVTRKGFLNDQWAEMLGYAPGELDPTFSTWSKRIHPEDKARVMEAFKAHLDGETSLFEAEHRLCTKSGEWKWILGRGRVVERDQDGKPLRVGGTHLDIDDRKRALDALRDSEEKFRLIADSLPILIAYVDAEQRYLFNNKAYEEWTRTSVSDIHGKYVKEIFKDSIYDQISPYIHRVLSGEQVQYTLDATFPDGSPRTASIMYVPHFAANHEVKGFVVVATEIEKQRS